MREYISLRGWFHIPDGHMAQFLRHVITYTKDEHSRRKLIRNLRKFVDVHRCINLYIEKLYCVQNIYGI
jgi:hypothetical protein